MDLIIGIDNNELMRPRQIVDAEGWGLNWGRPVAEKTHLGWVVRGPLGDSRRKQKDYCFRSHMMSVNEISTEDLTKKRFWLENLGTESSNDKKNVAVSSDKAIGIQLKEEQNPADGSGTKSVLVFSRRGEQEVIEFERVTSIR